MKNFLTFIFLALVFNVHAQDFEGTIIWSIKTDIKDPKMKAQMEQAQKQMNDPATQAQMMQLQEQMKDPQMKAMMESNPQMKAQMEKMMSMSAGGMDGMMPKSMTIKIKNQNTLTRMEGGMMAGDILYLKDKEQSFFVDRDNKTFSPMGKADPNEKPVDTKVTKTTETATVLGHKCTKYVVEMTEKGKTMTQYLWATTDLKGIDLSSLSKQKMNGGRSVYYKEIDGVPLKMQMTMPEMDMTMEATEIKKGTLPASEFTIPTDFKEVKGMFGN